MKHFKTEDFTLESGSEISDINIAYQVFGDFSPSKKVVWVCHALTANSDVEDWWNGLFGENDLFNSDKYTIVCANILGSCYGTSFKSEEKLPLISIRDMIEMHQKLADFLNISSIDFLIGGSLGGMQALEWAVTNPDFISNLTVIATNAKHSPWGIAFNEAQRMALNSGENGIEAARAIALLSYRNYETFDKTQEDNEEKLENFRAATYQKYQGEKLRKRFTKESYWILSKSMDSNNLGRNRISIENALSKITAKTLVIGIESDILFPISEQEYLAKNIKNSKLEIIKSLYGHDGFLLETKQILTVLKNYFIELKVED
ncbi:homoserine O-acetyltransferase family protein [Halpernia frigidisoli]|uniref:Homoserine O-acetyltransferase n=1 Tax=Halpernia frigidisoli TaxID=1125876 RepID=A0A1I3FWY5_9FLAO|nr:alpha/beta fold hydrolase [Halpernia frigidisoli]SFI15750.1 homoserine O-acetyltransferase [Halpernia frigidisoli]